MLCQIGLCDDRPSHDRIYTPGEKRHHKWMERKEKGMLLNKELQEEIKLIAKDLRLELPF